MEFITIGSCVSGNIIDGVFVKGSCVKGTDGTGVKGTDGTGVKVKGTGVNEEKHQEETVFKMPLENLDVTRGWITEQKYQSKRNNRNSYFQGPTLESNWLLRKNTQHGGFAVGGYPDKPSDMPALLREGLETFVCLNSEYGKAKFPSYGNSLSKDRFIHEPIDDMQTIQDETIIALARNIVERILNGESVYLHCAGGHGRTGTVALVALHMLYPKLTELELFEFVQYAHDQRIGNHFGPGLFIGKMFADPLAHHFVKSQVPSPQTLEQRNQVRRINKNLV
jgi:hypothetical protein